MYSLKIKIFYFRSLRSMERTCKHSDKYSIQWYMTYKKYIEIMTKKTNFYIVNCSMNSKYQILHPGAINTFYYRVVTII